MIPELSANDMKMFYKYLDKATVYFEYGSGGSTYQANLRSNIQKIYSVESDKTWMNKLNSLIVNNTKITYIYNEMGTKLRTWGYPNKKCEKSKLANYSEHIRNLSVEERSKIDLVMIDGRFRVACCLKCFDIINDECYIIFDDFLNRKKYHIILDYYDIVEKTEDKRMVVLRKKNNVSIPDDKIVKKYELVPD
jgi:protein O-GlcNAc transferase